VREEERKKECLCVSESEREGERRFWVLGLGFRKYLVHIDSPTMQTQGRGKEREFAGPQWELVCCLVRSFHICVYRMCCHI
jgi:hypothetical protein